MKAPTIIIPGIQGTKLANINKKNFDTVWSGIRKFFDNLYDIVLEPDGRTDKKKEVVIERQDVEDLAYSEIINYLRNRGYPVYIFGYDWRKSNLDSGDKLLDFVKAVRKKHKGNAKINFITHSMGCLVFSGFLKRLTENQTRIFINRAIFTVPPFKGSVEAMFNLIIGKSKLFNSSDDFRKIARTFPAIFELCPVYPQATSCTDGSDFDVYDYKQWQQDPSKSDYQKIKQQFEIRLADLKQVRSGKKNLVFNLSKLPPEIQDKMLIVAGIGDATQRKLEIDKKSSGIKNQFNFSDKFEDLQGDGTVHLLSAEVFKKSITTLKVKSRWIEKRLDGRLMMADWHSFFLNNGRVQNIIKRFLENDKANLGSDWYKSIGGGVKLVK